MDSIRAVFRSVGSLFIPITFIAALILTVGNVVFIINRVQQLNADTQWVAQSYQVLGQIQRLIIAGRETQIYQRQYLFTGDVSNIARYQTSRNQMLADVHVLQKQTVDNMFQQARILQLQQLLMQHLQLLDQGITIRQTQGADAVQSLLTAPDTPRPMLQADTVISDLNKTETAILAARQSQTKTSVWQLYGSILFAAILNFVLLIVSFFLIYKELSRRNAVEKRKDEFITIASHELRTPITSVKTFAQLIERQANKSNNTVLADQSKRLTVQVNRLQELVRDLLDVSRMQSGHLVLKKEQFDIVLLLKEKIETFKQVHEDFEIQLRARRVRLVYADKDRIAQVIGNLLENAIKYSGASKKIIVCVHTRPTNIEVGVQDFGIGIPKKDTKKIFERFYRTDQEQQITGQGLGLYIVADIVKRHGGKIWVTSRLHKGSTFFFTLPTKP